MSEKKDATRSQSSPPPPPPLGPKPRLIFDKETRSQDKVKLLERRDTRKKK